MRSFLPKIINFGADMEDRNIDISFLTEIWEKSENKRHQYKIEELCEMKGMKYISTPRPGTRRGGGAAIVVNTQRFSISKLNVSQPTCLEIVWGLMRPVLVTGRVTKIIVCSFYCPPKSTRKTLLIEHMTLTLQSLLTTFPKAGILISGDRNDLKIDRLLSIDRSLRQIVHKGTRGPNILTVVLTDLESFFQEPEIVKPIDVDDPTKGGVPSDHNGVVVPPKTVTNNLSKGPSIIRTIRPITASSINNMGQVFTNEKWLFMDPNLSPTTLTDVFEYYTGEMLNIFCPLKTIVARPEEPPYITENIKVLKRSIQREYEKRGKSVKYFHLKSSYDIKICNEATKYKDKIEDDVRTGNRSCAYSALRKLGVRPGETSSNTFILPTHLDNNLTSLQSAEVIADHFAAISQDYNPINLNDFPPKMKESLAEPNILVVPQLYEYEVFKRICKSKKPNSSVPGDLPKKLVQEFSCELTTPVTIIFNSILKTFQYPRQWVIEHQIPL